MPYLDPKPDLLAACLARPEMLSGLGLKQWDRLLPQAREAGMLGTLYSLALDHGGVEALPGHVRGHLAGAWEVARQQHTAVCWEVARLHREMAWSGVKPVLLKGAAYVVAGLPNAAGRVCNDLDILVPRDAIERVETVLRLMGWESAHLDAYDQRYYREWMHELPPMQHFRRGTTLDVHHNVLPETVRHQPDAARILGAATPAADTPFLVPTPAHMAIHSAVHLFTDSEWSTAIRNLYDFHCLCAHFEQVSGAAFWDELVTEARALHAAGYLYQALRASRLLLGTPCPDTVMRDLQSAAPGLLRQALLDWVFLHALGCKFTSSRPRAHAVARLAVLVRSHWLKMPPVLLARHLFHKAFISPRDDAAEDEIDDQVRPHG